MTRIIVAAKIDKILLQDTQSKVVILSQPSIIQVGITKEEVLSIVKDGNNIVITLKNGEKLILENFFQTKGITENSLTFPERDGSFALTHFDDHGTFTNYSGLAQLEILSYNNTVTNSVNRLEAYQTKAQDNFSLANLWSSGAVKAGAGLISAIGLGLLLLDGNNDSRSSPNSDFLAPDAPTAKLNDSGMTIAGTGEIGATIYVVDSNKKVLAKTTVDKSGHYQIELFPALTDGHKVFVNATDSAGNASKYTVITGTKDTIAPDEPQAQLSDDGTVVSGKAEANSTLHVYDTDGKLIGTAKANEAGVFSILVSPALTKGKIGTVVSEDSAGNKSTSHEIVAGKDTSAPDAPKLEMNKEGTFVKGTAEANSKVEIQDTTGKVIGSGMVDANGHFSISIFPALALNQFGTITIEDAAGNKSRPVEIKAGFDTLAPEKATAELNAEGNSVIGKAEADAKVIVYDKDNNLLGTAMADAEGKYSITLSKALTEKQLGYVYVIDAAGNKSDVMNITGTKDITAPVKAILTQVTDDFNNLDNKPVEITSGGTVDDVKPMFSGKAEPDAILTIYDNGKVLGVITVKSGTTTSVDWSFTPSVDLGLGSHTITLIQTDKAGNTSLVSDPFHFSIVEPVPAIVDPMAGLISALATPITAYSLENVLEQSHFQGISDSAFMPDHDEIPAISEIMSERQISHEQNIDTIINQAIIESILNVDHANQRVDQPQDTFVESIPINNMASSEILMDLTLVSQKDNLLDSLSLSYSMI
ncbi:Ig-like repeat protein Blp2 [Acinetobacter sp. ANC 4648]|uniref:Ig-like repeat protein Blp2 n=1 Tax=Acinetobacter sp. ANC 4648 TaxID=1977875 RepID=UPI000A34F6A4|nr:Ig-like repeat protein Blp2 [Acinetobacter sp. ANC 4648]OTG82138.1 hypothetical protein B9T27_07745 [Acinetobacter sp. ANC 4648]